MANANVKITELTTGTPVNTDWIPFIDISDTTQSAQGTTKKALKSDLKGDKGDTGDNATVTVGTTTTGAPGTNASVTNVGTTSDAIFDFVIPRGDTGAAGSNGTNGTDGLDITWLGAYAGGTAYIVNDAVSYNGSSYICTAPTTGNLPTDVTYWDLMALKGTDGAGTVTNVSSANTDATVANPTTTPVITIVSAPKLTTARAIYGNNFDGTAALTQIIASTYGGTGNGFTKFTGPTTTERTFTLPDSSATLLYSGGALGTPSSGVATNLTGTASGLSIGGNAATVTNGVYTTGTYADPTWITSLAGSKISGNIGGSSANVTGTVAIANGGTGQTSAQNAINALTQVAGATNEYVLTKDTGTGNATWKASTGLLTWGSTASGATGTGVALSMDNSYAAGGIGQSIIIGDTQTNSLYGLYIDTGASATGSTGVFVKMNSILSSNYGINIQNFKADGLPLYVATSGNATGNYTGLVTLTGSNTNSAFDQSEIYIQNQNNIGVGYNSGIYLSNSHTKLSISTHKGAGLNVVQAGAGGTAISVTDAGNVNSSTNGLFNITLNNTQSGASILSKLDTGTSSQAHIGQLINLYNASDSAKGVKVDMSTTGKGTGFEVVGSDNSLDTAGYKISASSNKVPKVFFGNFTSIDSTGYDGIHYYIYDTQSSATLSNRTTTVSSEYLKRTSTRTSGTTADNFDLLSITKDSTQNGVGGTFTTTGNVVNISNISVQTAGTLTDTTNVLKVTQSSISTGVGIYLSTAGTGQKALKFDTGFTTTVAPTGTTKYIIIDIGGTEYKLIAQATS